MINLLLAGNARIFDGILTCALSIFRRSGGEEGIRFYILTMDAGHLKEEYTAISDSQIEFLNRVARAHRPGSDFVKIDVSALYRKEFGGCPNEDAYCSPYTLLRLLADELPELPEL